MSALSLGLLLIAAGLAGWWMLRRSQLSRLAIGLRLLIVALLLGALANPVRPGSVPPPALVLLVDQSLSLPAEARAAQWAEARAAAERLRPFRPVQLVAFGADAALAINDQVPAINADGSDLAGALQLAGGLLPDGGEVVLVSDGAPTTPVAGATAGLPARQIVVNTVAVTSAISDVRLESLQVPTALRQGERFSADLVVWSSLAGPARLELSGDGAPLAGRSVDLRPGRNVFSFQSQAGTRGFHEFSATISAPADLQAANNTLAAWTVVGLPPRVLVVEHAPDSAAALRDALENAGLVTEAIRPAALPARLSQLGAYDSIILQDVQAAQLSLDQQLALREFVRSLGHGLVALGGSNSYSLGAYAQTPLEEVLPISMEPPPRRERPNVTLLLIVDRSASMLGVPGEDKFSLAKAAAMASTESLGKDDTIGVLAFDTSNDWAVEFTTIGTGLQLGEIQSRIADIQAGGGTNIYDALDVGLTALDRQTGRVRHAVLLTDGRSGGNQSYEALVAPLRAKGITLSTIAIGEDADIPLLQSLARLGAGRYHFAAAPEELPRLTLQETEIAREDPVAEGDFQANLAAPHPAIRGLDVGAMPAFSGYVAVTPKPDAEQLLRAPEGDVLLATWQYGLGRATAWTSDAGERWTATWTRWAGWGPLMAQIVAATYPDPADSPLRLQTSVEGDRAEIILDAVDDDGAPIDLASVGLRVVAADGAEQILRATQFAPGRYRADAALPAAGAYQVLAALERNGARLEARGGLVRPYSPEWAALPDPALLSQIAGATGGRSGALADLTAPPAVEPLRPALAWWPFLVGAALLLWLVEVAAQRGWLRRWIR
ncbi:MAG TPA: VWA domain-containing protein [Herpetosiphonaceae bacterium]|nr:VWA domain-containing protein [Herpetosiphonaceae bacterium]